jgi:hypothetical protein
VTKQNFQERLAPGFGMQLAATLAAPMTFLAIAPFGIPAAIIGGVVAALGLVALLQLRAPSITISEGRLSVGNITLPTSVLAECEMFTGQEAFAERGPRLDPRAARLLIGDIDSVVKIRITDPEDPTPYLLVSTRKPAELCAALAA